jgi:hypothetical protein
MRLVVGRLRTYDNVSMSHDVLQVPFTISNSLADNRSSLSTTMAQGLLTTTSRYGDV